MFSVDEARQGGMNVSTKSAQTDRIGGWHRTPECWYWLAAVVLPFGWVLPLCRFAWVRVNARRAAREERSAS
jgi:hypothetical protein